MTTKYSPVADAAISEPTSFVMNSDAPAGAPAFSGLYFLGEKDTKYVDLVQMEDPFPDNPGVKLGSLVEAKTGKGRWLYLGLGLWRQVPAETEGAYQLLANLISLPKAPAAPAAARPAAPVKK